MSNQKANLEKHIEKIASTIDISGKESIAEETSREFPGWSWKCDIKGKYISCSDEVFDCLGIVPNAFINKSLNKSKRWDFYRKKFIFMKK